MSITLRDLVARGTPLDWFESVALVQAVCAASLAAAHDGGARVPDLAAIHLDADGDVLLSEPGPEGAPPVFRAGSLLNALLPEGATPVPLRLLVLTAISPTPRYATLLELSQALEYFERPDRRAVIRVVYERAMARPAVDAEVQPLPEAPPEPAAPARTAVSSRWRRHRVLLAAGVPLVVALVVAGWWWSSRPAGAKLIAQTTERVSHAMSSAVDAVRTQFRAEPPAPVVEAPPPVAEPSAVVRRVRARAPRPIRPARSLGEDRLPAVVKLAPSAEPPAWGDAPAPLEEVVRLNLEEADPAAAPDVVYSPADGDVRPPVAVQPKLPADPPDGVPREALTRLEVLVSADGEVESARIVAGPRVFLDGMMLSVVKAWRFQPATKDGRPVPYRQQVWLTTR